MTAIFRLLVGLMVSGRGVTAYLFCLLVSVALLKGDAIEKRLFVDAMLSTVLFPAQLAVSQLTHFDNLAEENKRLKLENAKFSLELNRLRQAKAENERLRSLVGYKRDEDAPLLLCRVVGRGAQAGRLETTIIVDRGQNDGVEPYMPVVTTLGLVGRVARVFADHSIVRLINDPVVKVSVVENRTRTAGILETPDGRDLHVVMPAHAGIKKGDTLVTSGYGGVFPKGIAVGVAQDPAPGELDVIKNFAVIPLQDPLHIEDVFIILKKADWVLRAAEVSL